MRHKALLIGALTLVAVALTVPAVQASEPTTCPMSSMPVAAMQRWMATPGHPAAMASPGHTRWEGHSGQMDGMRSMTGSGASMMSPYLEE